MSLRDRVVKLVQEYYAREGSPPSMRYVARTLRISTKTLYKLFPGGAEEVYRAAGIKREDSVPSSFTEFLQLYTEYLRLSGRSESAESLCGFISDVLEHVRSRLGRAAAERLAQSPLSVFNRVAKLYLEARRNENG
ncbi:MAG: TusE/DsrC/DsvC family sulfur relay protein [Thermofilaceae archaeon]